MTKTLLGYQDKTLKALKGQASPFYLAGGTALSKFYFQHRDSYDLDFFTQDYSTKRIDAITTLISEIVSKKIKLVRESQKEGLAKIRIYEVLFAPDHALRIDFVEDFVPLIGSLKQVDGIDVLSLDDIYFRKIHAIAGTFPKIDKVGQKHFLGGRQEAKDYYDLYQLSSTYLRLSEFVMKHCDDLKKEALVRWYHVYDRLEIKVGLTELKTRIPVEFSALERHFKREIDAIIGGMV
jgi:predicted nucleotidyltransferase component of viral defense system